MVNNYTIQIVDIVEQIWAEGHPEERQSIYEMPSFRNVLAKIDEKIDYARPFIFQFDYPCYGDEDDKAKLERHILRAYYTRNINVDSFSRWLLYLEDRLDDIMPKYKVLYETQQKLIASNALEPYHIEQTRKNDINNTKDRNVNIAGTSNSSSTSETDANASGSELNRVDDTNKFSNTPQALAQTGLDYLSNMTKNNTETENSYSNTNTTENQSTNTSTDTTDTSEKTNNYRIENYHTITRGNLTRFTSGKLVEEYNNAVLMIEKMITDELADLFYLIY